MASSAQVVGSKAGSMRVQGKGRQGREGMCRHRQRHERMKAGSVSAKTQNMCAVHRKGQGRWQAKVVMGACSRSRRQKVAKSRHGEVCVQMYTRHARQGIKGYKGGEGAR